MNALRLGLLLVTLGAAPAEPAPAPARASPAAATAPDRPSGPASLPDRLRGLLGIAAVLSLTFALSEARRAISRRVVLWGLALQWAFALLVLRSGGGRDALTAAGRVVEGVLSCAVEGA